MTNYQYSMCNTMFMYACAMAEIEPTARQASKFRNKKGSAYIFKDEGFHYAMCVRG